MTPRELPRSVVVGRVIRPHGVLGELLVEELSDVASRFAPGSELFLKDAGGEDRRLRILAAQPQGARLRVRFAEIEDRSAAEGLRGRWLEVPRESVPRAADGQYYFFELLGCLCRDRSAGPLGAVIDVREDGGGLLLEVSDGERRVLIPFVRAYLRRADMAEGELEFDLPEGLIEACASKS